MTARVQSMGWSTREPCSTCPYRKDAPLGRWHRSEFEAVAASEASQFGAMFGCHETRKRDPQVCGGWLVDQARRNVPNLNLRVAAIRNPEVVTALREVGDGGHDLYTAPEMCRANGVE